MVRDRSIFNVRFESKFRIATRFRAPVLFKMNERTIHLEKPYKTFNALCGTVVRSVISFEFVFKKPGYQNAIPLLPFAAIIYLFRPLRLFISFPYSAIKYSKPLPLFYLLVVVVKIGSMYFLVTRFDVFGAIISTWISYGVEILILYFGIRGKFDFKFNIFKMIIGPLSLMALILLLEPFFGGEYSYWVHSLYVLVAIGMLGWAYRTEIRKILSI